ncbi:FUSC family protein [Actinacidiphila glaucinigra]|uniref:FUSC family protein n=1 Tax=Actinacidiphila glaucinigra TaxID=235986 RepID=UPI0037C61C43
MPHSPAARAGGFLRDALRPGGGPGYRYAPGLRAAVSMGIPLTAGAATGHLPWGLAATMGAFAAVYGAKEPYARRAVLLAGVGAGFVLSVAAGSLAGGRIWLAPVVIGLVGAVATYVCDALRIGPPGGYLFALACAMSTPLPFDGAATGQRVTLTAAGAACAWLVSMSGFLVDRSGPETTAVADAYEQLAAYLDAIGGPRQDAAQHQAAIALRTAWYAVAAPPQPRGRAGGRARLRTAVRQAHHVFAAAVRAAAASREPLPDDLAGALRSTAGCLRERRTPPPLPAPGPGGEPAGRRAVRGEVERAVRDAVSGAPPGDAGELLEPSGATRLLASARKRHSLVLPAALRVGSGAVIAGWLAHLSGFAQPYWASGAAIVVLQGANVTTVIRRGLQRGAGTAAGVLLGGTVLAFHPGAAALVAAVMLAQFAAEAVLAHNYALGVAFITPLSLFLTEAAQPALPVGDLVTARLLDTVCGCVVGVAAGLTLWRRTSTVRLPSTLAHVIRAEGTAWHLILTTDDSGNGAAASARHRLRTELINLRTVADSAAGDRPAPCELARLWPAIAATQQLGYLAVSTTRPPSPRPRPGPGPGDAARVRRAFDTLAASAATGAPPPPLDLPPLALPARLDSVLHALHSALSAPHTGECHRRPLRRGRR